MWTFLSNFSSVTFTFTGAKSCVQSSETQRVCKDSQSGRNRRNEAGQKPGCEDGGNLPEKG